MFVVHANDVYGNTEEDVAFFEAQLEDSEATLQTVQDALTEFEARNPIPALEAELSSRRTTLSQYLSLQQSFTLLIDDAEGLKQLQQAARLPYQVEELVLVGLVEEDGVERLAYLRAGVPQAFQCGLRDQ